jgi:GntR family transcriptional regulator/MocR family aminotransferase
MLPYQTLIQIDKTAVLPVYLQISNALIMLIKKGILASGTKLPGTRSMAEILNLHRQTVVRAFEELYIQGWLEQTPSKGTFVSKHLPEINPKKIQESNNQTFSYPQQTGYAIVPNLVLHRPALKANVNLGFDDGFPDVRLAPWEALSRQYRAILQRGFQKHLLSYADTYGNLFLREQLAEYLRQSRGLPIHTDNILITRGCIMGIYQVAQTLLKQGDKVAVTQIGYMASELVFK